MSPQQIRNLIKDFDRDWVPSGPMYCDEELANHRQATGLERCCACVGDDCQSGPIYCGRLADYVADVNGRQGVRVAMCRYHALQHWGKDKTASAKETL